MIDCSSGHWSKSSEASSISIHFLRTGSDSPSLILLHGLMGNGAIWTPFMRAFGQDLDLIMPDARGHGRSSAPSHGYKYDDHADDVCGLIDGLKLCRPVLVGHSMGGMTAALAASRLGSKLSGVVLVDPTFISLEWQREVYESEIFDQHRLFLGTSREDLIVDARARHSVRAEETIEIVTDARLMTDIKALEVLAPPNPDFKDLIASISAPILLVLGSRGIVSVETAQELVRLNPGLSYERIEDAGHAIPYDNAVSLAAVVRSFVERTAGKGR